jgi:hypothetical protein
MGSPNIYKILSHLKKKDGLPSPPDILLKRECRQKSAFLADIRIV